jgi:putative endonuclease
MKRFTSKTQQTGQQGEEICMRFLVKQGFSAIERNYTCSAGEIDIIAKKDRTIHFIEVKSVSCDTTTDLNSIYNPLNNVDNRKMQKIKRAIQKYVAENSVTHETFQIDAYAVYIDKRQKEHKIRRVLNIT